MSPGAGAKVEIRAVLMVPKTGAVSRGRPAAEGAMVATEALDSLYSQLPTLECQGKCQASCGPVFMSRVEWQRIKVKLGYTPQKRNDLTCPMLHRASGQCRVYAIRPTLCRLWGLVESMKCPWGCKPDRYLTDEEGYDFLRKAGDFGA